MYGFAADSSAKVHVMFSSILGIRTYSYTTSIVNNNFAFSVVIVGGFLSVLVERFSRHVRNREEFFEFLKGKRK